MITRYEFFQIADVVVQLNGRAPLSDRPEVVSCVEVLDSDYVLQILAGPGSGKTEALVWRILFELFAYGTDSASLLVTTFTKKAANELQVRIADRSESFIELAREAGIIVNDPRIHNIRIGTLHSLCDQLLTEFDPAYRELGLTLMDENEHRARLGYSGDFVTGRTSGSLSQLMQNAELAALFRPSWVRGNWPSSRFHRLQFVIELYSYMIETYIPRCEREQVAHGLERLTPGSDAQLRELYEKWRQYLDDKGVIDFAGIQLHLLDRQHIVDGKFTHVFVDEFQDNNPIQFLIHLGWLNDSSCRLTVVGDDDQAIYRFRGSDSACFHQLEGACSSMKRPYRLERLELNHRSSRNIRSFCQSFRDNSTISKVSMQKTIQSPEAQEAGFPVRVIRAPMITLANLVAREMIDHGYSDPPRIPRELVAILASSTSEKDGRPASAIRTAFEEPRIRVYNPRAKTAALRGSALSDLLGVLSYLIDPIQLAPAGKNGRMVEVWALHENHSDSALTAPPSHPENADHIDFQKWFRKPKGRGSIAQTPPERQDVLNYVDEIKQALLNAQRANTRLTLAGLIARLLSLPHFNSTGFTVQLLRQALFTQLLESFILPTRQTMSPLDTPLEVQFVNGKWVWDDKYWRFLGVFASVLKNVPVDDIESEAFEEGAVPLITFHQAKGLEFDHVYVIGGGKPIDVRPVLKNFLFSGRATQISIGADGLAESGDNEVLLEAAADVDRELYVALSRGRKSLTLLSPTDPQGDIPDYAREHSIIQDVITSASACQVKTVGEVEIIEVSYE